LIDSLKRAFNAFSKNPFPFAWGSLLYIFLCLVFIFAVCAIAIAYFVAMSIFNQPVNPQSIPTMLLFGMMILIFMVLANGLNAALSRAYRAAFWKEKTNMTSFFAYALDHAPGMFAVMLARDLVWLVLCGPALALYVFALKGIDFMDLLTLAYVLFVTFLVHMVFTPVSVYNGALEMDLLGSFKRAFNLLKRKHIYFVALYSVFAITWVLNFIPFLQLFSIFFLYPVTYTAMIAMLEGGSKTEREESE